MRQLAIDYHGSGVFQPRETDAPAPADGEVEVKVAFTGICGTDLKIASGAMDHRITSARPIGHEMSGTISRIGRGVEGWHVGDAVTVMPLDWCGACPACRAGDQHICQNLDFVGIDSPGSLQERWNVRADWLVRLPPGLELRAAALVEPTAVAVHDLRRARVSEGDSVVVVGCGPIGLLIALTARHLGASVLVSELEPSRLRLAERLGIDIVDASRQDLVEIVLERTDGAGADVAFEVSGSDAGVRTMTEALRVRGRGIIVAIHPHHPPVDLFSVFWKELELRGARVYQRPDFEEAIRLVTQGVIPVAELVTDVLPLSQVGAAFDRLREGGDAFKVLVSSQPDGDPQMEAHDDRTRPAAT